MNAVCSARETIIYFLDEKINGARSMVDIEGVEKSDLEFPHAAIVRMVRNQTKEGQYVRNSVYLGLNKLLEEIADEIIAGMVDTENAYIERADLEEAARKYENVEKIIKEKERITQKLLAFSEDMKKLSRDIEEHKV